MRFLTAIIFILFALIIPLTLGFPILPVDGDECAVPCDEIVGGGPPKDGIPAIDVPSFISAAEYDSQYAEPDDLILGVFFEGEARAYPADILNWHEIVNDEFNGISISITYCPLTWSGIAYQTTSLGKDNTLGTTGKLYENNLVFYDRQTDTYWSQILGLGIKGEHIGKKLPTIPIMQTRYCCPLP
jgi:hypothetical protein